MRKKQSPANNNYDKPFINNNGKINSKGNKPFGEHKNSDANEMFLLAVKELQKHPEAVTLSDLACFLPCTYKQFMHLMTSCPLFMNELKALLEKNKTKQKMKLRKFWGKETAPPALQKSLYQLLSDEDELRKLSGKSLDELNSMRQEGIQVNINNTPVHPDKNIEES